MPARYDWTTLIRSSDGMYHVYRWEGVFDATSHEVGHRVYAYRGRAIGEFVENVKSARSPNSRVDNLLRGYVDSWVRPSHEHNVVLSDIVRSDAEFSYSGHSSGMDHVLVVSGNQDGSWKARLSSENCVTDVEGDSETDEIVIKCRELIIAVYLER